MFGNYFCVTCVTCRWVGVWASVLPKNYNYAYTSPISNPTATYIWKFSRPLHPLPCDVQLLCDFRLFPNPLTPPVHVRLVCDFGIWPNPMTPPVRHVQLMCDILISNAGKKAGDFLGTEFIISTKE